MINLIYLEQSADLKVNAANERVSLVPFGERLELGQVAHLRLNFHFKESLRYLVIDQEHIDDTDPSRREYINDGEDVPPVLWDEDGNAFVNVRPLRLGKLRFSAIGRFSDGGLIIETLEAIVEPSRKAPVRITVGPSTSSDIAAKSLRLGLDHPRGDFLQPEATYDDVKTQMWIDPRYARYRVVTKNDEEIVRLNEATGHLSPVREGSALVETHYGGLTTKTCVVVGKTYESVGRDDCRDLTR